MGIKIKSNFFYKAVSILFLFVCFYFFIYFFLYKRNYVESILLSVGDMSPLGYSEYKASDVFNFHWEKVCFIPPEIYASDSFLDSELKNYFIRNKIEFGENRWAVFFEEGKNSKIFIIVRNKNIDYPSLFDLRIYPGLRFSVCKKREDAYVSVLKNRRTYFFIKE
jgi:hypothetical protein